MAKKHSARHAQKYASNHSTTQKSWLPENAYVGVVAVACLFVIALIVLKGPSLLGSADVTGEAYMMQTVTEEAVDHMPPDYASASCVDTDGVDILATGIAKDAASSFSDECVGRYRILEAACLDGSATYAPEQVCPQGTVCTDGKCA